MDNKAVIDNALKLGIEKVGFCSAKEFNSDFKSVIAAAFPYYTGEFNNANISKYCFGLDYHKVIYALLEKLAVSISLSDYKIFCDTGKNDDRKIAQK